MGHRSPEDGPASQLDRQGPPWLILGLAVVLLAAFFGGIFLLLPRMADTGRVAEAPTRSTGGSFPAPSSAAPPRPTTPTTPSKPPEPKRGTLVIHGTGDVAVDPIYIPNLRTHGYEYAWSGLKGLFEDDDLTVINLECPITNEGVIDPKEFNFRCDPKALPSMRKAGIEVANQGNNHAQDYGKEGMLDSRTQLLDAGIASVGTGKNSEQATALVLFQVNGWKVAVVGFGGVFPSSTWAATKNNPGMANGDATPSMVRAVKAAGKQADLVIVVIHWGTELATTPDADDVERAHALVDAGADMIFGHHSHRLQPLDTYEGAPIFWSLGNFVWPVHSAAGADTAVAEVIVKPSGKMKARLLPATITADGHPELDRG